MEESIYKHNYEYLSIEEAKAIVNGTFVQGTTNIGGELATKSDIGKLLDAANKKLTSIVPSTEFDNEFICFFECEDIETFPDDLEHRWIEVSPIQFTFPADGGSVKITGSYGLTGTLGTRKKVGDIADTITADANSTPSTKSGSKTYHYNNNQSDTPTAKITWTQPGRAEQFPKEWTYVFQYNISDTNGVSSTGTSWSRQYYANGQEIKQDNDFTLNGITSYRTKTGTFGTVKKENVQYSGQIGRPSGYNYSDKVITQNGRLAQQGSNKQLQWSYTQEANVKVWGISADPTSLHFTASGGTSNVQVTTWYTWQYNDNNNQQFDQTTTTEQITAEANTSLQQKTWTEVITKNNTSVSIKCTQDGREEVFTYKYFIKVGYKLDALLADRIQLVWQNDQYSQSSKKTFYVYSYKQKINERGEVVATEQTGYSLKHNSSGSDNFSISNRNTTPGLGRVDCFPIEENTRYESQKTIGFQVYNVEDETVFCNINLIQERKGIQIVSGDAIMFTYNWDKGNDLDQATFVNLNLKADRYDNYAGYGGSIVDKYKNILYFAGDNTGKGNEYAFIDFKSISEYLSKHGDDESSVDGKTILQSLINENGIIGIQCNLYTNWFSVKESQNIILSYSVYNKDSEGASVNTNDKQFVLTGYTKKAENTEQALCYSKGGRNVFSAGGPSRTYTLSAKFTYYFNSGVFSFETNKDNVDKWQKGIEWTNIKSRVTYNDPQFTNNGKNVNFTVDINSINEPDYFDKSNKFAFYMYIVPENKESIILSQYFETTISQLPYKVNWSVPLSDVVSKLTFGENDSVTIYPHMSPNNIVDEDSRKILSIDPIIFNTKTLTIQKPST